MTYFTIHIRSTHRGGGHAEAIGQSDRFNLPLSCCLKRVYILDRPMFASGLLCVPVGSQAMPFLEWYGIPRVAPCVFSKISRAARGSGRHREKVTWVKCTPRVGAPVGGCWPVNANDAVFVGRVDVCHRLPGKPKRKMKKPIALLLLLRVRDITGFTLRWIR